MCHAQTSNLLSFGVTLTMMRTNCRHYEKHCHTDVTFCPWLSGPLSLSVDFVDRWQSKCCTHPSSRWHGQILGHNPTVDTPSSARTRSLAPMLHAHERRTTILIAQSKIPGRFANGTSQFTDRGVRRLGRRPRVMGSRPLPFVIGITERAGPAQAWRAWPITRDAWIRSTELQGRGQTGWIARSRRR